MESLLNEVPSAVHIIDKLNEEYDKLYNENKYYENMVKQLYFHNCLKRIPVYYKDYLDLYNFVLTDDDSFQGNYKFIEHIKDWADNPDEENCKREIMYDKPINYDEINNLENILNSLLDDK
jgi:hypothetical protein